MEKDDFEELLQFCLKKIDSLNTQRIIIEVLMEALDVSTKKDCSEKILNLLEKIEKKLN